MPIYTTNIFHPLLDHRQMAQERVLKNKDLMAKIAAKKPIPISGGDAVLTSATATEVLANMDLAIASAKQKVDVLYDKIFTPERQSPR